MLSGETSELIDPDLWPPTDDLYKLQVAAVRD